MDAQARAESITMTVSDALAGSGDDCVAVVDHVHVQQAGKRRLVRIFLARDLSGLPMDDATSVVEPLSLDEIAGATRVVSTALDESDVLGQAPYTLEVSSVGLDRPLTTPAQFRRNVGRLLALTLVDGTTPAARLIAVDADGLELDGTPPTHLPWSDVTKATVQVEFSRPERKDT